MTARSLAVLASSVALGATSRALALAPATNAAPSPNPAPADATLTGWASLPADTFVLGSEPSGYFTGNPAAPFPGQPVQGFSGVHALGDGTFLAMSDNGFGAKANSQDVQLRVHHLAPHPGDGTTNGTVDVLGGFTVSDPDRHIPSSSSTRTPSRCSTTTTTRPPEDAARLSRTSTSTS